MGLAAGLVMTWYRSARPRSQRKRPRSPRALSRAARGTAAPRAASARPAQQAAQGVSCCAGRDSHRSPAPFLPERTRISAPARSSASWSFPCPCLSSSLYSCCTLCFLLYYIRVPFNFILTFLACACLLVWLRACERTYFCMCFFAACWCLQSRW